VGKTSRVVIGMDPHKRTVTIEAMSPDETVVDRGRFTTDVAGFEAMLAVAAAWPERVWAVEGCEGIGKHVALRLLDHGETVVDVPAKLSARMRVYATGQGRKTGDERELPRRRRVHPSQLPAHPEPRLVEVRDIGRDQRLADRRQRRAQLPGDPLDHPRDRARGDRDAEQVAGCHAGPGTGRATGTRTLRQGAGHTAPGRSPLPEQNLG
jgi:Transposase